VPLSLPGSALTDGVVVLRLIDERDVDVVEQASRDPDIARRFALSGRGAAEYVAVRLVARWALRQPGIARVQLWTSPENTASQRVAERSGFQREGTLRSYGEVEGERVDAVFFSLLASDLDT
jgi:hypothetical protein